MSVPDSGVPGVPQPRWRELCEKALFELNEDRIMQRVVEAQQAIDEARQEYSGRGGTPPREELSLQNAENALRCLRSIYERRSRDRKAMRSCPGPDHNRSFPY